MSDPFEIIAAHKFSSCHRNEILTSGVVCGCFHCCQTFDSTAIVEWVDEDDSGVGQTALCPRCGIDSVISSCSGFPVTLDFLKEMRHYWFGDDSSDSPQGEQRAETTPLRFVPNASPSKRPASHKWALFVFIAVVATNIRLNLMGQFDILGIIVTIAGVAAFFSSLFFARSPRTYTLGMITLALVFVRSLQSLWFDIVAYRNGLFHAPQSTMLPFIIFAGCAVALLLWLFQAYTFGASSRQYYDLPPIAKKRSA